MSDPYAGPPRILVGVDGSADALRAVKLAAVEAVSRGAELVLVCAVDDTAVNNGWGVVYDTDEIENEAKATIHEAAELARGLGVPTEKLRAEVMLGDPVTVLSSLSAHASALVVGRRATTGERRTVGSTSVGVVASAHSPVILVASDAGDPTQSELRGVIGVALGPRGRSSAALDWAVNEASRRGSRLVVITVVREATGLFRGQGVPVNKRDEVVRRIAEETNAALEPIREAHPEVQIDVETAFGQPVEILHDWSAKLDALVLSVHLDFPTYTVGSTIRGLMAHAECPLVLLR